MRQLLGCWLDGDDTLDFVGLDESRWQMVRASGLLGAVAAMVAAHAPSLSDEGSLELHEHAVACWSAACGLQPDGARAAALCEAGAVQPTLRALEAVAPVLGGAEEAEEEVAAAAELARAAGALLQALARTEAGRAALRAAGGAATLATLLVAVGDPSGNGEIYQEMGALRRRLMEGPHGQPRRPGSGTADHLRLEAPSRLCTAALWAPEQSWRRLGPAVHSWGRPEGCSHAW